MRGLEVIRVWLYSADLQDQLRDAFQRWLDQVRDAGPPRPLASRLHSNPTVASDWMVGIVWPESRGPAAKSELGRALAASLRHLGMVDHTVWSEEAGFDDLEQYDWIRN